jgi:hypothetical protein
MAPALSSLQLHQLVAVAVDKALTMENLVVLEEVAVEKQAVALEPLGKVVMEVAQEQARAWVLVVELEEVEPILGLLLELDYQTT